MISQKKKKKITYLFLLIFRRGKAVETFCMNPSIARRISQRLAYKAKEP